MGSEKFIGELKPGAEIVIANVGGDLVIEGEAGNGLRVKGDNPNVNMKNDGSSVEIVCGGDCRLRVPIDTRVTVEVAGADAKIGNLAGIVQIRTIGADLVVRNVGGLEAEQVGADLDVKSVEGDVKIHNVGADARFRDISGNLEIEHVGADTLIRDVHGNCTVGHIGADLVLNLEYTAGVHHHIDLVGADVYIGDPGPSARFVVPDKTDVSIQVEGLRQESDGAQTAYIIGNGEALVEFEHIGGQLRLGRGRSDGGFNFSFEANLPDDLESIINARISEQIGPLHDHLRQEADRLRREAERTLERHRDKLPRRRQWDLKWNWPEKAKRGGTEGDEEKRKNTPSEPVSDNERLAILRMLEDKRISVEEAERLLAALE